MRRVRRETRDEERRGEEGLESDIRLLNDEVEDARVDGHHHRITANERAEDAEEEGWKDGSNEWRTGKGERRQRMRKDRAAIA